MDRWPSELDNGEDSDSSILLYSMIDAWTRLNEQRRRKRIKSHTSSTTFKQVLSPLDLCLPPLAFPMGASRGSVYYKITPAIIAVSINLMVLGRIL